MTAAASYPVGVASLIFAVVIGVPFVGSVVSSVVLDRIHRRRSQD